MSEIPEKSYITASNILMAEFLQFNYYPLKPGEYCPGWRKELEPDMPWISEKTVKMIGSWLCRTTRDMMFNKSWDWIMNVVYEIEKISDFKVSIKTNKCEISNGENTFIGEKLDFKFKDDSLAIVYNACEQFITWWNNSRS